MTAARPFVQRIIGITVRTSDEDGQDFAEYAIILGLVVLVGAAGISNFGTALGTFATNTVSAIVAFM